MTAQELIDELTLIENKNLPVKTFDDDPGDWCNEPKEEQLAYWLAERDGSDCFELKGMDECDYRGECDRCKERENYRLRACALAHE